MAAPPQTVVFACVHNAGRSQMAAASFNRMVDRSKAWALSAGTDPATRVHPEVIDAMRELGVDLASVQPQRLTDELAATATMLVTMGCGEACPVVPGVERNDWPLQDPKGQSLARVREIRAEIDARVQDLLLARAWLPWAIRTARPDDRSAVEALLLAAELPTEGVADHFAGFTVATEGGVLTGVVGIEHYGTSALLRSLAVRPQARRRGLGAVLARHALARARAAGVSEAFLLTTTAHGFFAQRGFERVERSSVPLAVTSSAELRGACPDSATVMRKRL
jgi:arsenate reductase